MPGKRITYMDRYARSLAAAHRVQAIEKAVQSEQDRVQYLDSLIATERQTLAAIADGFSVQGGNLESANALLKEAARVQGAVDIAAQAGRAAASAAASVPKQERAEFVGLLSSGQVASAANKAVALIGRYPGAAAKVLADVERFKANFGPDDIGRIRAAAGAAKAPQVGVPRQAREQVEQLEAAFAESLESAYFAGPSGIRGGIEGLELVNLREMTAAQLRDRATGMDANQAARLEARAAALDDSEFATGQDALDAALAVVRTTGEPSQVAEPLARTMYEEARARQAYRNDQRADFEQGVLDSRRRLSQLEQEKTRLSGAYDDPRQETLRRDLRSRGYKVENPYTFTNGKWEKNPQAWRNAYIMQQDTPEHAFYIGAHERRAAALADDKPLAPSTRSQNLAVQYTMMRDRRGETTNPEQLATQLGKAGIKGQDLTDAVAFTMAYWNLGGPSQDPESLRLRKQDDARKEEEEEDRRRAATSAAVATEEAREAVARQERDMVAASKDLRFAQSAARKDLSTQVYVDEYKRQMAMGRTREEAVAVARDRALAEAERAGELAPDTAGPAGRMLMGEDALLARQAPAPAPAAGTDKRVNAAGVMVMPGMSFAANPDTESSAAPVLVQDPSAPAYSYRRGADGIEVWRDGQKKGTARAGTTAYQSIESVLSGGAPIALAPAAPEPVPEPEPEPEPVSVDYTALSDDELRRLAGPG
jgi:hypothetical protein